MMESSGCTSGTQLFKGEQAEALAPLHLEAINIPLLCEAYQSLTHREREVADLLTARSHPKRIGRQLELSTATIHSHLANIKNKLRATSLTELAALLTIACYETARHPSHLPHQPAQHPPHEN